MEIGTKVLQSHTGVLTRYTTKDNLTFNKTQQNGTKLFINERKLVSKLVSKPLSLKLLLFSPKKSQQNSLLHLFQRSITCDHVITSFIGLYLYKFAVQNNKLCSHIL